MFFLFAWLLFACAPLCASIIQDVHYTFNTLAEERVWGRHIIHDKDEFDFDDFVQWTTCTLRTGLDYAHGRFTFYLVQAKLGNDRAHDLRRYHPILWEVLKDKHKAEKDLRNNLTQEECIEHAN